MKGIRQEYTEILAAHLKQPDETHLFNAYNFGKKCAEKGVPISKVVSVHFEALESGKAPLSDEALPEAQGFLLEVAVAMSAGSGRETSIESVLAALYDETVKRFEKKLTELQSSEERFSILVQMIPDIVYRINRKGIFTYVNEAVRRLGYKPEEIIGKHFSEIILPSEVEAISRSSVLPTYKGKITGDKDSPRLFDERRTEKRMTRGLEVRLVTKNYQELKPSILETIGKEVIITEVNSSGMYEVIDRKKNKEFAGSLGVVKEKRNEVFIGTVGTIRDITDRKLTEEELYVSKERFRLLVQTAGCAIIYLSPDNAILEWNHEAERIFGRKREDILGRNYFELFTDTATSDMVISGMEDALSGKAIKNFEIPVRSHGGPEHILLWNITRLLSSGGSVVGIIVVGQDITERKKAEEERLRAKAEAEAAKAASETIEGMTDAVVITDLEGRMIQFNMGFTNSFGWGKEVTGGLLTEYVCSEDVPTAAAAMEECRMKGSVRNFECVMMTKDQKKIPVLLSITLTKNSEGNPVKMIAALRDITDRKKIEEELLKAHKIESVGILAGGIAHDFNNLLTGILGNISLAKMFMNPDEQAYRRLMEAEKASLRAKDLTQQLLTFSKGGEPIKKVIFIGELIRECVGFVLRGSNVSNKIHIPDDLWLVEVDEGQINQAIHNIIINAEQAMPQGGAIHVRCENITLGSKNGLPLKKGRYIKISIKDEGIGIPDEYQKKIFDPYFTTKQKGSGLGLSITYSIIKKHSGHIAIESEPGVGTTFYIYLSASEKKVHREGELVERTHFGKGRILVMDDEEMVREVAGEILKTLGYDIGFSKDGGETIERYKEAMKSDRPFDIVIMDLTIPGGMGGKDAIKKLLEIDPDVKAIVSSGYSGDPTMADFKTHGFKGVVSKPYKLQELSDVVGRLMGLLP